jgi:hypothetical protein
MNFARTSYLISLVSIEKKVSSTGMKRSAVSVSFVIGGGGFG